MKIRFLLPNAYGRGGTIRTTLSTAGALAARGHDVEVVSVLRPRREPAFPVPPAVRLQPLTGSRPSLRRAWRRPRTLARALLQAVLSRFRSRLIPPEDRQYAKFSRWTDLVLWRYLHSQHGGAVIGTQAGLNLVLARHAPADVVAVGVEHLHLSRHAPAMRAAFAAAYPRLDAVVTLTEPDAAAYRALLGPGTRVACIPNAVPLPADIWGRHADRGRVVLAAGRLVPQKGFDLLIRAWQRVATTYPDWQLRIYGEGAQRQRLQRQIDRSGLSGQVRLMGFSPALADELARASLFVLSSRFEGFPLVLLEAMAAGLPVVAFDCPTGPSALIRPGVNGLLVPPESVPDLARAIRRLLAHPRARQRLGEAARLTSLAYGSDMIALQWEHLLTEPPARGVAPSARWAYGPPWLPRRLTATEEEHSGRVG